MLEVTEAAAKARLQKLSTRTEAAAAAVRVRTGREAKPAFVLRELQSYLTDAFNRGLIIDPPHAIAGAVLLRPGADRIPAGDSAKFHTVQVGAVNFKNRPGTPRITRSDDAWFDFGLILREADGAVELFSYRFALRIPSLGPRGLVRFDLNPPGHPNDDLGLRAHTHLFTDDDGFSVPSPLMSHIDVLDVILFRLRSGTGRERGKRTAQVELRPSARRLRERLRG
jgi:hypothetical protein